MNIDTTIRNAITPIVPVCVPNVYTGAEVEYCVFNYSEFPAAFADNSPQVIGYSVQVHLFMPLKTNPYAKKAAICAALFAADFTYPQVINATDEDGQHYVFSCVFNEVKQ